MIGPLACPHCRIPLDYRPGSGARCLSCEAAYEERYGILDLLPCPAPAVTTELRGLASENGIDFDSQGAASIKFLDVGAVEAARDRGPL